MTSPAKPFACEAPGCEMRFTNEDHLNVHSRKHDLELQLALGNKSAVFPADQTPTPTRFIRNCEEVGLFQDLQNVNPFDEGFKRAMDTRSNMLASLDSLIASATSDDALHTPHIFPNLNDATETNLYNSNKTTITRSSSDESTTVKHFESTIETKLTNEVTIKDQKAANNFITIHSNIEIRKDSTVVSSNNANMIKLIINNNKKDLDIVKKDVLLTDAVETPVLNEVLSTDLVNVETPKEINKEETNTSKKNTKNVLKRSDSGVKKKNVKKKESPTALDNYEVMIKLPNGELVHMKSCDIEKKSEDSKSKLKEAIECKVKKNLENKIRNDIQNKIKDEFNSGNFLFVKTPEKINTDCIPSIIQSNIIPVVMLPKPSYNYIPITKIPISKVAIPSFKLPSKRKQSHSSSPQCKRKNNVIREINVEKDVIHENSKEKSNTEHNTLASLNKTIVNPVENSNKPQKTDEIDTNYKQHDRNCDILNKVGGICNCEVINQFHSTTDTSVSNNLTDKLNDPNSLEDEMAHNENPPEANITINDDDKKERLKEAVRRYRARQKGRIRNLEEDNKRYEREKRDLISQLSNVKSELANLKQLFIQHCGECDSAKKIWSDSNVPQQ